MSTKRLIGWFLVVTLSSGSLKSEPVKETFESQLQQISDYKGLKNPMKRETFFWLPKVEGKTRYKFEIPAEGLKKALKYQDIGPLYYLTSFHDTGLNFSAEDVIMFTATPDTIEFDWFRALKVFDGRYSVGLAYGNEHDRAKKKSMSFGYAKILDQEILVSGLLKIDENLRKKGALGTTFLNHNETVQYTGWLEHSQQNRDYYELALQRMAFQTWRDIDSSIKISYNNKGDSVSTAIHKDIGFAASYLGLEWSDQSNALGFFIGFTSHQKNKNGSLLKIRGTSTSKTTTPSWLDDLKPLRRAELMKHWQKEAGFQLNKQER